LDKNRTRITRKKTENLTADKKLNIKIEHELHEINELHEKRKIKHEKHEINETHEKDEIGQN